MSRSFVLPEEVVVGGRVGFGVEDLNRFDG